MGYTKRDWDNTGNDVTKEDFKRIETGIETNDKQINVLAEKVTLVPTPKTGYKIIGNYSVKQGNVIVYDFQVQKSDGSVFATNTALNVVTLPYYNTTTPFAFCGVGQYFMAGAACSVNADLYVTCNYAGCTTLRLSGVMIL